jgi:hypothetical protein
MPGSCPIFPPPSRKRFPAIVGNLTIRFQNRGKAFAFFIQLFFFFLTFMDIDSYFYDHPTRVMSESERRYRRERRRKALASLPPPDWNVVQHPNLPPSSTEKTPEQVRSFKNVTPLFLFFLLSAHLYKIGFFLQKRQFSQRITALTESITANRPKIVVLPLPVTHDRRGERIRKGVGTSHPAMHKAIKQVQRAHLPRLPKQTTTRKHWGIAISLYTMNRPSRGFPRVTRLHIEHGHEYICID